MRGMYKPGLRHPGMLTGHWRNFPLRQIRPRRPSFASDVKTTDCVAHNAGRSLKQIGCRSRRPAPRITRAVNKRGEPIFLTR